MKKVLAIIICFISINTFSQISFIGYSQPVCIQPITSVYTYTNWTSGMGSGTLHGFTVYRNGSIIYSASGSQSYSRFCDGISFINDSTGFIADRQAASGIKVFKTDDYGVTWTLIGQGGPTFKSLYPVNANYVYLVSTTEGFNPVSVIIARCSDVEPPQNLFILDQNINSDICVVDTSFHNSICNIDSLDIFLVNSTTDTIAYHINRSIPLMVGTVSHGICAGNSINISYTPGAVFNPGNVFTAELSDVSGSFASAVNIGSVTSTSSGTINAVIPPLTPSGNGYRVRVVSSNPIYYALSPTHVSIDSSVPVFTAPNVTTCIGTTNMTLTAQGASNYYWSTGATTSSISVTTTFTQTYTVNSHNSCGTTVLQVVAVIDTTCQDVWPGDANSDGIADNLDILELGLHYTQTGAPRSVISNNWQAYVSNNWIGMITNGKNVNHSDCNGDGTIDANDTLAVYNNYGLSHTFRLGEAASVNPQLKVMADQSSVIKGHWGSSSVYLGDATNTVSNINGVAYTVTYDNWLIETDSIYIEYQSSFLNTLNQNLNFRKRDFAAGNLYTATTHTLNGNVNGYGKIATIHYKINPNITSNQFLRIGISQGCKADQAGLISALTSNTVFVNAVGLVAGINEILDNDFIFLVPNPTTGQLTINCPNEIHTIEVSTITGQVLLRQPCTGKKEELQLEQFSNGVYFVKIFLPDGRNAVKKVVVNH